MTVEVQTVCRRILTGLAAIGWSTTVCWRLKPRKSTAAVYDPVLHVALENDAGIEPVLADEAQQQGWMAQLWRLR